MDQVRVCLYNQSLYIMQATGNYFILNSFYKPTGAVNTGSFIVSKKSLSEWIGVIQVMQFIK